MKLNYLLGSLSVMMCVVGVISTGNGQSVKCCPKISQVKANVLHILNYTHQDQPLCPVKAVRFLLRNQRTICSDPEDPWAKRAIKILDSRTTRLPDTTTSTPSPGITTGRTVTMTTPKGTSSTWKPMTYTHSFSTKQPQWTTTQIIKMKTTKMLTTRMESTPLITDIKTTDTTTAMTTESPVTTTTPKDTSTTSEPPTTYITYTASTKDLPRNTRIPTTTRQITTITERGTVTPERKITSMTTTTSKGTSTTRKPTAYITHTASPKKLPRNTRKPQHWTTTKQIATISATTAESRVTMPTSKGTSTTERPGQKTSTMNVTLRRPRCPPIPTSKLEKHKNNNSWLLRRLKKKRKQGLRRVQMNPGCIDV